MENENHAALGMQKIRIKKAALVLLAFLLFSGCRERTEHSFIGKDKMIEIMSEVYLIEMHYQKALGVPSLYTSPMDSALSLIFRKHNITRKDYEQSFIHYVNEPKLFQEMNEKIIQNYNKTLSK